PKPQPPRTRPIAEFTPNAVPPRFLKGKETTSPSPTSETPVTSQPQGEAEPPQSETPVTSQPQTKPEPSQSETPVSSQPQTKPEPSQSETPVTSQPQAKPEQSTPPQRETPPQPVGEQNPDSVTSSSPEKETQEGEDDYQRWQEEAAHSLLEQSILSLEEILEQVDETPPPPPPQPAPPPSPPTPSFTSFTPVTSTPEPTASPPKQQPAPPADFPPLAINLLQDTFIRRRNEPILISGHVKTQDPNAQSELNKGFGGQLCYRLRDPQQGGVLLQVEQPLSDATIPLVFNYLLDVPTDYPTRLLLGDVRLEVFLTAETGEEKKVCLAQQTFSITAGVDELLNVVKKDSLPAKEPPQETAKSPEKSLNTEFFSLSKKTEAAPNYQPKSSEILPPKLGQEKGNGSKSLKLPNFSPPVPKDAQGGSVISFTKFGQGSPEEGEEEAKAESPASEGSPESAPTPLSGNPWDAEFGSEDEPEAESSASVVEESQDEPEAVAEENPWESLQQEMKGLRTPWDSQQKADSSEVESEVQGRSEGAVPSSEAESEVQVGSVESEVQAGSEGAVPSSEADYPVEEAFQSLRLQDRFWRQIQALADAEADDEDWQGDAEDVPLSEESIPDWVGQQSQEKVSEGGEDEGSLTPGEQALVEWERLMRDNMPRSDQDQQDEDSEAELLERLAADTQSAWEALTQQAEESSGAEKPSFANVPSRNRAEHYWRNQEIVVEDEEDLAEQSEGSSGSKSGYDASGLPYPDEVKSLGEGEAMPLPVPEEEEEFTLPPPKRPLAQRQRPRDLERSQEIVVPTPMLDVVEGELAAGDLVFVKVRLPDYPGAIYVKLWVIDVETRQLLDGPRAFVDFERGPGGQLETLTQLMVPMGSLQIRFEAIAIDVESQRESHKAICDRAVVPPNFHRKSYGDW
ncbi:hypothetical protein PN462_10800, partial [Spirulina sp. CS-785/01]|nr:hypothetical protein [Spirulina sp. CS-785/01]